VKVWHLVRARSHEAVGSNSSNGYGELQEALDAWSLGVMAFELLTGKPPLNLMEGKEKVCALGLNGWCIACCLQLQSVDSACSLLHTLVLHLLQQKKPSKELFFFVHRRCHIWTCPSIPSTMSDGPTLQANVHTLFWSIALHFPNVRQMYHSLT
jgi:serine/threonine protein kinase